MKTMLNIIIILIFISISHNKILTKHKIIIKAICIFNNDTITGSVELQQIQDKTIISYNINGLSEGKHGFHIHKMGKLSNHCNDVEGHYNPFNHTHAGREDVKRHMGDLGNLYANENGVAHSTIESESIKLSGPYSVIGRSFVLHEEIDDLGRGDSKESKTTGNSGIKIACCVINKSKGN